MLFIYDATTGQVIDITSDVLSWAGIAAVLAAGCSVAIYDFLAFRTRRIGGINFGRLGRVFFSFGISRRRRA